MTYLREDPVDRPESWALLTYLRVDPHDLRVGTDELRVGARDLRVGPHDLSKRRSP
jgi:hypothetical protein